MSVIFRAPIITAIAVRSTTAANTALSQPNFNVRLPLAAHPPFIAPEFDPPPRLPVQGAWHHRPGTPITGVPFSQTLWPAPTRPLLQLIIDPVRNRVLLPLPPPDVPFNQDDWPLPWPQRPPPHTHLFYYMQDQTSPAFIQYDWPKAPKLPTVDTPPIRNEILFPIVSVAPPFRPGDWINPVGVRLAKDQDPESRNVLLPPPMGIPTYQTDWPNPQGAKAQQGSYTLNDLGLLTLPIARPVRPIDWPNPKPMPYSAAARAVRADGVSILLVPRFKPEWAADSNQLLGPTEPQPETH